MPLTRRGRRALRLENAPVAEPFELLEPVVGEPVGPLSVDGAAHGCDAASDSAPDQRTRPDVADGVTEDETDAFDAAARLFSFTAETPIQTPAEGSPIPAADGAAGGKGFDVGAHVAAHRIRTTSGSAFRKATAASFSVGVMGIVGLLTVGMTTPAEALTPSEGADVSAAVTAAPAGDVARENDEIQAYIAPAEMQNPTIERAETYSTVTMAEIASESGIANYSNFFVNDPNAPIQWPFAVGVPISYGFGMRDGTMHEGVDFTPGEGSPIQAITDGVVRESTDSSGAFGVHIVIDHVIDGVLVSSSYSHMLYGSREVEVGDHVTVGTIVGHTGNTGRSFGAHTHFEMLANGTTPIDPVAWLREHAGG